VGECCCSPASPYGGPTCEWHATISKHGKRVCNSFAGVRKTKSKEIAPTGELVTVNEHGVYQYFRGRVKFGCKLRTDVGSILKTRLIPNSVTDFRYVVKTIKKPNEEEFTMHGFDDITPIALPYPTKSDFITDVCNAFSSDLPSFMTTAELTSYLQKLSATGSLNDTGVFLDMTGPALQWRQRSEYLMINATRNITDPCTTDPGVCRALNFNNYVFNVTSSFLTNGLGAVSTVNTVGVTLAMRASLSKSTVVIAGASNPAGINVEIVTPTNVMCSGIGTSRTCNAPASSIRVYAASGTESLSEVGVFASDDEARLGLFV
jgi:hypothetical protein